MRIRSVCCCVLVWAFVFVGFNLANGQPSKEFGKCSYYSVDSGICFFQAWELEGKLDASLINASLSNAKPNAGFHRGPFVSETVVNRKPVASRFGKPLKSVGFFKKTGSEFSGNSEFSPNWDVQQPFEKATWDLNYQPVAKISKYRVKWYKKNVKPIATAKVITIVQNQAKKLIDSSRLTKLAAAIDLDSMILESVRLADESFSRITTTSSSQLNALIERSQSENVAAVFNTLLNSFHGEKIEIELPVHLRGSEYWQYYEDCDRWDVLINTAIDDLTFEAKPTSGASGNNDSNEQGVGFIPLFIHLASSEAIFSGLTQDWISMLQFEATESELGFFLHPSFH